MIHLVYSKKAFLLFIWLISCFMIVSPGIAQKNSQKLPQSNNGWKPLEENYPLSQLADVIIPRSQWKPYPTVQQFDKYQNVPEEVKEFYIHQADSLLDVDWPRLPATLFLQFARSGNRSNYESFYFKRRRMLATLVLAELFQHKGRYTDQIINGIWAICEESFWGLPAHLSLQKAGPGLPDIQDPVVDLFAAQTAQDLAWTYYLLKPELDKVNPLISQRIVYETRKRIFKPYLEHTDWWYMGYGWREDPSDSNRPNNWDPWISSNVLSAALVLADDPNMRLKLIHKTMETMDNFVVPYPADGSSDEGPEYWGVAAGCVLDYLDLLKSASGGDIDYFNQPVIREMGQYIYKMNIAYPYYVNYGDADAIEEPDPGLLYRFGKAIDDPKLTRFAAFEYEKQSNHTVSSSLKRALPALINLPEIQAEQPSQPLIRDSWLPNIQVMTARSNEGSKQGFYLMAKGGTNGASHNHNDVGNYIVFYNGNPVLVDAGAMTYTKKTFSSHRYEIWDTQSRYHNLPDINGVMEHSGASFRATDVNYHQNDQEAFLQLNLATAYPDSAYVNKWVRKIILHRGKNVELSENYSLSKFDKPLVENFLTPCKPDISKEGKIILADENKTSSYQILYDEHQFEPSMEEVEIDDQRMTRNWGHRLYHVMLHSKNRSLQNDFNLRIVASDND